MKKMMSNVQGFTARMVYMIATKNYETTLIEQTKLNLFGF
jgi:hypothetical protein